MLAVKNTVSRKLLINNHFGEIKISAQSNHFWYSQNAETGVLCIYSHSPFCRIVLFLIFYKVAGFNGGSL